MAPATLAQTMHALSTEVADLAAATIRSVVLVHARAGRPMHGIAIEADLVLTLDHAIERESPVLVVAADGREVEASIAGRDAASNLAVLRASGLNVEPLSPAEATRPGHLVVAVARGTGGIPMASLTTIQSVTSASTESSGSPVIRTDGAYGPAFAGAPLVDASGRLVAQIPAGRWRAAGVAMPAQRALEIARTLSREGRVARAFLGIQCQAVAIPDRQRAGGVASHGLLVVGMVSDGAAERAGVLIGDIIVSVAGEAVSTPRQLHTLLARTTVGSTQRVEVVRGTAREVLQVTLGQQM